MKRLIKASIAASLIALSLLFVTMTASATTVNVTGIVEVRGGRFVLLTVNDVYVLGGDQIPADIIGKEIVVTGSVEMKNQIKVINVFIYDKVDPKLKKS